MSGRSSATIRLTQLALLTTVALIIFVIEANIPPMTSVPGVKMGLANIVTLSVFYLYGRKDALIDVYKRQAFAVIAIMGILFPSGRSGIFLMAFVVSYPFISGIMISINRTFTVIIIFTIQNEQ